LFPNFPVVHSERSASRPTSLGAASAGSQHSKLNARNSSQLSPSPNSSTAATGQQAAAATAAPLATTGKIRVTPPSTVVTNSKGSVESQVRKKR